MAQQSKKKNAKGSIIVTILCSCIVLALLASIVKQHIENKEYETRQEEYRATLSEIEKENENLDELNSQDDELKIIEKYAREKGYAMPDDHVYKDITPGN